MRSQLRKNGDDCNAKQTPAERRSVSSAVEAKQQKSQLVTNDGPVNKRSSPDEWLATHSSNSSTSQLSASK